MACPICGRVMCDHSPTERGQTNKEMMDDYYSFKAPITETPTDTCPKCGKEYNKTEKNNASCFGLSVVDYHNIHCKG